MGDKLRNISYYMGLMPFHWLYHVINRKKPRKNEHYLQALALNFLLFCSVIIFLLSFAIHSIIIYFFRDLALTIPIEISFYILGGLLIVCFLVWLEGIVSALLGRRPLIALFSKITCTRFSTVLTAFHHIFVIMILIVAMHSSSIAQKEVEGAEIFLLYDDMGSVPRWVFTLGFYLDSLIAINRFGDDSVAIAPLNSHTMAYALENGRFVFVSSHGADGYIILEDSSFYGPQQVNKNSIHENLQFVYLSGCDTGLKHEEWAWVLSPATVITFDRLSTTLEHMYWLFVKGPGIISDLK